MQARGTYAADYAYRYDDKLHTVTSDFPTEGTMTNDYDGEGKLRLIVTDSETQRLRWDAGWHMINREDGNGALTDTFVNDPAFEAAGSVLAVHVGSDPASGGTWNYFAQDIIRSTRAVYAHDTSQLGATEFTPYGSTYATTGTTFPQTYTGHYWLPEAGQYYAPYRMYSPEQARWSMRDPAGMADGPNVYGYVGNNSIHRFDSDGRDWTTTDFVDHYFLGGGVEVSLKDKGLLDDFKNARPVKAAITEFYRIFSDAAWAYITAMDRRGKEKYSFSITRRLLTPVDVTSYAKLYAIGDTILFRTGACTFSLGEGFYAACSMRFGIEDAFEDPLSAGCEIPGGTPYAIRALWTVHSWVEMSGFFDLKGDSYSIDIR